MYNYAQAKNTTSFQYFAQVVVGAIIAVLGILILYYEIGQRSEEIRKYSIAQSNFWGWTTGVVGTVIGLFMAHAGLIYWARILVRFAYKSKNLRR